MFPVVVNMGISGDIEINGPADPQSMKLKGDVKLESGEASLASCTWHGSHWNMMSHLADIIPSHELLVHALEGGNAEVWGKIAFLKGPTPQICVLTCCKIFRAKLAS